MVQAEEGAVVTTPTILEACADNELFAFPLWEKQKELLAQIDRGPRLHVWCVGRRAGKTTLSAIAALHNCIFRPDLDEKVRIGETRYAIGVATNQSQARLLVNAARSIIETSPLLAPLISAQNEDSITFILPSGACTQLRAFPCSSRAGRGWPVSYLGFDEAAHFMSDVDGYQAADRVFASLAPATAQFGDGARIVVCSTPFGTEGFFADLFTQAQDGEIDACAMHAPTSEVNPTITPEFLASEQERDPGNFESEYGAVFQGSGGAFLDFSRFEIAHRGPLEPDALLPGSTIVGLDPAFSQDPFGVAVVGRSAADEHRFLCALVQAWAPPRADSFEERRQVEDRILDGVAAVCHRYGATAITDQYLARSVVDRLSRLGIYVDVRTMSAASKTLAYQELRSQLFSGLLGVYDDPTLIAELRRLRTKHSAGSSQVVSPRVQGSHGDLAQALALAAWAQAQRGGYGGRLVRSGTVTDGMAALLRGQL